MFPNHKQLTICYTKATVGQHNILRLEVCKKSLDTWKHQIQCHSKLLPRVTMSRQRNILTHLATAKTTTESDLLRLNEVKMSISEWNYNMWQLLYLNCRICPQIQFKHSQFQAVTQIWDTKRWHVWSQAYSTTSVYSNPLKSGLCWGVIQILYMWGRCLGI